MKKLISLSFILISSFVLVACGTNTEQTRTTLTAEENGVTMEITLIAEGDLVVEQTADNIVPYAAIGASNAEEAEEIFGEFVVGYEDADGVEHDMDYQDDQLIESLTVNYAEADIEELNELTGASFDGDAGDNVSLESTIEMMEEQGFEIVE